MINRKKILAFLFICLAFNNYAQTINNLSTVDDKDFVINTSFSKNITTQNHFKNNYLNKVEYLNDEKEVLIEFVFEKSKLKDVVLLKQYKPFLFNGQIMLENTANNDTLNPTKNNSKIFKFEYIHNSLYIMLLHKNLSIKITYDALNNKLINHTIYSSKYEITKSIKSYHDRIFNAFYYNISNFKYNEKKYIKLVYHGELRRNSINQNYHNGTEFTFTNAGKIKHILLYKPELYNEQRHYRTYSINNYKSKFVSCPKATGIVKEEIKENTKTFINKLNDSLSVHYVFHKNKMHTIYLKDNNNNNLMRVLFNKGKYLQSSFNNESIYSPKSKRIKLYNSENDSCLFKRFYKFSDTLYINNLKISGINNNEFAITFSSCTIHFDFSEYIHNIYIYDTKGYDFETIQISRWEFSDNIIPKKRLTKHYRFDYYRNNTRVLKVLKSKRGKYKKIKHATP